MAVIINEFEVVADPQPEPVAQAADSESHTPAPLSPGDIERVQRYLYERRQRLLAD